MIKKSNKQYLRSYADRCPRTGKEVGTWFCASCIYRGMSWENLRGDEDKKAAYKYTIECRYRTKNGVGKWDKKK